MQLVRRLAAAPVVAILCASLVTACSPGPTSTEPSVDPAQTVELFGGQQQYDQMMALYNEAVAAGQKKVVIYGPEAPTLSPVLQKTWQSYFPEIQLEGVLQFGPGLSERMRAEAVTGRGVGDIVESGSSFLPGHEDEISELKLFAGSDISEDWRGPKGVVAVGLIPFAFAYNTSAVQPSELPKNWSDLLQPQWKDRLAIPDPTTGGVMYTSITAMIHDKKWSATEVQALAAQNPEIFPPTNFNGPLTAVAQGQRAGAFWVSVPQLKDAKSKGAPVDYVFPVEKDNIAGGLYVGLLKSAPNPLAAQLYANWRLTKAGANAAAGNGLYSLLDGAQNPEGLPALKPEQFLQPVPFADLPAAYANSEPILKSAFAR